MRFSSPASRVRVSRRPDADGVPGPSRAAIVASNATAIRALPAARAVNAAASPAGWRTRPDPRLPNGGDRPHDAGAAPRRCYRGSPRRAGRGPGRRTDGCARRASRPGRGEQRPSRQASSVRPIRLSPCFQWSWATSASPTSTPSRTRPSAISPVPSGLTRADANAELGGGGSRGRGRNPISAGPASLQRKEPGSRGLTPRPDSCGSRPAERSCPPSDPAGSAELRSRSA